MKYTRNHPSRKFKRLKFGWLISLSVIAATILLAACAAQPAAEPSTIPPTAQATLTSTTEPTATATLPPTATPPPTVTSTPRLPVLPGTVMPQPANAVFSNLEEVVELARWGKGVITNAIYAPNGKVIALASPIGIRLHDANTLDELLYIETGARVNGIAFSPDGQKLAGGLDNNTAGIWSVSDGELLHTLEGHTEDVTSVAFSPDGSLLATGSVDRAVKVWKVADGSLTITIEGIHSKPITDVLFSLDGQAIFSASEDSTTHMVQVSDGKLLKIYSGYSDGGIDLSSDGKTLVGYGQDKITIWQVEDAKILNTLEDDRTITFDLSPDGKLLATAGWDYSVRIWDLSTGLVKLTLEDLEPEELHFNGWFSTAFSPDGMEVMLAGREVVGFWNVAKGALLRSAVTNTNPIFSIAVSPDESMLAFVEGLQVNVRQISDGGEVEIKDKDEIQSIEDVAFSTDGKSLLVGMWDGSARIWPLTEQGARQSFEATKKDEWIDNVAFSPDGKSLAFTAGGVIELRNLSDGVLVRKYSGSSSWYVNNLVFSRDGSMLASSAPGDRIMVFKVEDGSPLHNIPRGVCVAFSPDDTLLAGGLSDKTIRIWDVKSGKQLIQISDQPEIAWAVAFSPDGQLLVTGDSQGAVSVWNVADGTLLKTWQAHSMMIESITFLSNGNVLITASYDGTIRFWGLKP
ncbi:MAG: WD40 repeat domain-containing protein [Chloroflexota bacterium]